MPCRSFLESRGDVRMLHSVAIGCDPNAKQDKELLSDVLRGKGYTVTDFGSDDPLYANVAHEVACAVASGKYDRGILICGTGIGMSLAANKVKGIRAVCCSEPFSAKLSKQHNNSNILCFGARVVGTELAKMIVASWMDASFEGGRHQVRIDMIQDIENRQK